MNDKTPIDLASLDLGSFAEQGSALELEHPLEGTPIGVKIYLIGAESKKFKEAMNEGLRRARKSKAEMTVDQADLETSKTLAAVTTGWENVIWEGQPLEFSKENAIMLYRERSWIREQVDSYVSNVKNFSGVAKKK